jgi:hypothetical protein
MKWPEAATTFQAEKMTAGQWARVVDDPDAAGGKAVSATVRRGRASHIVSGGWAPVKTDARYLAAFRLRMGLTVAPDTDVAKVLYPGTENLAATFHMASPLRLEAVHRTRADDPASVSTSTITASAPMSPTTSPMRAGWNRPNGARQQSSRPLRLACHSDTPIWRN